MNSPCTLVSVLARRSLSFSKWKVLHTRQQLEFLTSFNIKGFCGKKFMHTSSFVHSSQPTEWNTDFKLPSPEFDYNYLCDEKNSEEIMGNIENRKGVGDIHKVKKLWKELKSETKGESKVELLNLLNEAASEIPNRSSPASPVGDESEAKLVEIVGSRRGVRKRDGSEYEPDTLTSIQNSIDRHLKNLKIATNIKLDPSFSHSRRVLEAKRKSLKAMGKGNKPKRADPLSQQELAILYDKKILGSGNPDSLLNTVWINNATHFGLRGRQEHVNLCWGDITLKTTSDDKEYLEYNERNTKTRTGAQKGDYRRVIPKMFAVPENENCPVKIYKVYQSHRPVDMNNPESRFYLRPLINPSSQVWYSHQCLGKDKLGKMMAKMANEGELAGRKVNHSTRKTFATSLVHAGISPSEIAHLGGWKNVQSINDYSVPSVEQQQQASNILSNAVIPMSHNEQTTVNSNSSNDENTSPLVYSNSVSKCTAASEEFSPFSMFAGANISGGNITINIVPPSSQKKMNFTQAQSKN